MEEQMIFGALQTLNEEAFEDVFEERSRAASTLEINRGDKQDDEIDVVYLQSNPLLPHTVVSCASDSESYAHSVESSYSPYKGSISRASSVRGPSTNASPKQSVVEMEMPLEESNRYVHKHYAKDIMKQESTRKDSLENEPFLQQTNFDEMELRTEEEINKMNEESLQNELAQFYSNKDRAILSSLPDIFAFQNGQRQLSISDQLSSSSFSSLERLKKISKKLQKVFSFEDTSVEFPGDVESTPLVVAASPAEETGKFKVEPSTYPSSMGTKRPSISFGDMNGRDVKYKANTKPIIKKVDHNPITITVENDLSINTKL